VEAIPYSLVPSQTIGFMTAKHSKTRAPSNLVGVIVLLFAISFSPPSVRSAEPSSTVEGNTAFALDLYAQLKTTPGNLFFSPCSISTALAMTYAGAKGQTEKQMGQALHFDSDQRRVHSGFAKLQGQLGEAAKQKGIELSMANALWAQRGHPFLPGFLQTAKADYNANINQADFVRAAESARVEINQWVSQRTKNRIQDILPPGSLDANTRLILANAIYFKGIWETPFEKAATSIQPFQLSATKQADTPLMHHVDTIRYMENSDFQAVELPYRGGALSMVVLLPREIDGCGRLEDRLNPALLSSTLEKMTRRAVDIFLPKFKLESSFDFHRTLVRMGMPDAFGPKADFSGMDGGAGQLYISGVFHKAWGEVNEEGTEAAAATAIQLTLGEPEPSSLVFRADHPFIFFIRQPGSGSLLFLGRFVDPAQ